MTARSVSREGPRGRESGRQRREELEENGENEEMEEMEEMAGSSASTFPIPFPFPLPNRKGNVENEECVLGDGPCQRGDLIFNAAFEGGNLGSVTRVSVSGEGGG